MWLSWGKSSACRFVVGKSQGKIFLDDLHVAVGTKIKWFLETDGGRMRSGFIWLIELDKETVSSENTDVISCNIRRGGFLEYLRIFWFPKEDSHIVS
jgi:hypothetical protein